MPTWQQDAIHTEEHKTMGIISDDLEQTKHNNWNTNNFINLELKLFLLLPVTNKYY